MKIDYTPTDTVTITPNEFGPYCSVFTNKDKTRIGIRLHRCRGPSIFWMDSKVTAPLIAALQQLETTIPASDSVTDG